jgi:D-alanyl-D-alanine carboxypeptidase
MQPPHSSPTPAAATAPATALAFASAVPSAAEPALELGLAPVAPASATPTSDGQPPVTNIEPLPKCALGDVLTSLIGQQDWPLTMVDPDLMVPADYVPDDLVGTDAAGFSRFFQVRSVMIPDLKRMGQAAAAAGAPLGIASAYRSYDTQVSTFSYWVNELGYDYAILSSARPGHSEHQLGLAIDFEPRGGPFPWVYHNFAKETAAGQWLAANAWKFGFIMSYPYGSTPKSCYGFEPWHYRYFGVEEAALIHASGLTTREWMWRRQPNPESPSPMETPAFQYVFPGAPSVSPTPGDSGPGAPFTPGSGATPVAAATDPELPIEGPPAP